MLILKNLVNHVNNYRRVRTMGGTINVGTLAGIHGRSDQP